MRVPPRILIADDSAINVDILRTRLAIQGYEILTAADGEEALTIVRESQPDLILLDMMMPKKDGIEVCRQIRGDAALPFIPIIMVTARSDSKDVVAGLEAGCDEYLTKPVDRAALVARVKSMLRIKELQDTVRAQASRLEVQSQQLAAQNQLLEAKVAEQLASVRLASRIQNLLLPKEAPVVGGYDVAGQSTPAQIVGGDYFDFIEMDSSRIAICLGDVSGKGLPASLLMANLQATIRGQALHSPSTRECLERANMLLFRSTEASKFATIFYGILDLKEHLLRYTNAGHNPPLLISDGHEEHMKLSDGGTVLGIFSDSAYDEGVVALEAGNLLVIYSDGVTEATNVDGDEFGEDRLLATIREHRHESAAGMVDRIAFAVQDHARGCSQGDDITLVVVKRGAAL